jgi:hypothetical protein
MALMMPLPVMADETASPEEAQGTSASEESAGGSLRPARERPHTPTDAAFADAREILSRGNSCSSFFGGAEETVTVLDALSRLVNFKTLPDRHVGIRMTGDEVIFISHLTGYQYRLFKKVIINTNGPFYSSGNPYSPLPRCGSFAPNTREARVLMLLHELGHLIKGANGRWLLTDDGGSYQRSLSNTKLVESKCLSQIKALQLHEEPSRTTVDTGAARNKR